MNNLIVKIVVIISLLLFGSIAYEKYANTKDTMEDYINKYNQYRGKVDSTNKMVDSLKTIIAIEANEAHAAETRANGFANNSKKSKAQLDSLRSETDSLRKTIKDSTEMARVIIPKLDSVISKQDTLIAQHKNEIANLRISLTKKDTIISKLTLSRDSLQTVTQKLPEAPKNPNKMFGITLPSRTTSFIAGTLVGIVAITAIKR